MSEKDCGCISLMSVPAANAARTRQHTDGDILVPVNRGKAIDNLRHDLRIKRAQAVGPVQRDKAHATMLLEGECLEGCHNPTPLSE
jgi:hypothetical protein